MLYYFLSYPHQRGRPPIIAVSQVLCLERLQSQTHFLSFETKLSQVFFFVFCFFFYCFQNYILLSSYIRDSVYLKTVKLLFCVTTSFNMTRIHFSTKRPLVKILQRNLIGKHTIYYSLSIQKSRYMVKYRRTILYVLKEKEEKICCLKIGALVGDLLMKDRHVLDCLLDRGFQVCFFFYITNGGKVYIT